MSKEALKIALDHLMNLQPILGNGLLEERQLAFIDPHIDCAITALQEALAEHPAQPQQETVAWLDPWTRNNVTTDYDAYGKHGIPLYTRPPARKPLTDEQIAAIGKELGLKCRLGGNPNIDFDYARAIEAAHNIKENT